MDPSLDDLLQEDDNFEEDEFLSELSNYTSTSSTAVTAASSLSSSPSKSDLSISELTDDDFEDGEVEFENDNAEEGATEDKNGRKEENTEVKQKEETENRYLGLKLNL